LTFVLEQELYAVNVKYVLEVLEQQQITRVPKTPEHILGIINFRGEIFPVINTRIRFNMEGNIELVKNYIIVYDLGQGENHFSIAATADGVKDVIEISQDEIRPVPEMGISYDTRFIEGTIRYDEKFILLINPEKVFTLSATELIEQSELIKP
jgi:purine-binding chemotaxis protein CheW